MLTYEFYKVLHLSMILIFIANCGAAFVQESSPRFAKIAIGVSSFFILVGGMGLLARIGFSHGAAFPGWVWAKIVIWGILSVGVPVLSKRLTQKRMGVVIGVLFLAIIAAYLAVNKPF